MEITTEFESRSGLILWLPKDIDISDIRKKLRKEITIIKRTPRLVGKEDIISLIKEAEVTIHAYPNRKLRFYISKGIGCPNNVNFEWKNLTDTEQIFLYRYNPASKRGD